MPALGLVNLQGIEILVQEHRQHGKGSLCLSALPGPHVAAKLPGGVGLAQQTQTSMFDCHFQNLNFSQGGNMSRKFSIPVLSLAFAASLMVVALTSYAVQAAPAAQEHGAMGGSPMGPMTPEARLKMLTEKLNLTEDQQAKLKPILEDQSKQMKALHDDTSLAPADKQAKMKELHESSIEKLNAILTPDQQAKWKQMRQEMMQKHNEMKGQGQMDHQ
jgi:periplasmic protein CpxP/Spy